MILQCAVLVAVWLFGAARVRALAPGGVCPAGRTYSDAVSTSELHTLAELGVKRCFFASSRGSDANAGGDEGHPLLHLPGMAGCAKSCAAIAPVAGEGFIVEGGSQYFFQGAGGAVGLPWEWRWSGTGGAPLYVGVDVTWHAGSTWTRPVLSGGNPVSRELTVVSCLHANDRTNFFTLSSETKYVIVDDFEATGGCYATPDGFVYFYTASSTHNRLTNIYAHGWTRAASCKGSGCGTSTAAFSTDNGPNVGAYNVWAWDVVDGADTAGNIASGILWNCYDIHGSVIRYIANQLCNAHTIHEVWIDHTTEPVFSGDHGNSFEENGSFTGFGPNSWYNNVVSNMNTAVGVWLNPQAAPNCEHGGCDYVFNNLIYASGPAATGNYFNIGDNLGPSGTTYIFNNTFEDPSNGSILRCNERFAYRLVAVNNRYITDGRPPNALRCRSGSFKAEQAMTHEMASQQRHGSVDKSTLPYARAPEEMMRAGAEEVGTFCSALRAAGEEAAGAACASDVAVACSYDVSTHRVGCPASVREQEAAAQHGIWGYEASAGLTPLALVRQ